MGKPKPKKKIYVTFLTHKPMIEYKETQNTLQALAKQYPLLKRKFLKKVLRSYKYVRESKLIEYLNNLMQNPHNGKDTEIY